MNSRKQRNWLPHLFTVFISVVISSTFSYQIAKDALNKDKQFRVVDVKQISKKLMANLDATLKEQNSDLNPEMIKVIAQNEAKKMFTTIANTGGENDIIIPKSSVLYVPSRYEITEEVAEKMGLKGVVEKDLNEMIANAGANGAK